MELNVSNIQHFSVGDGPGIRTTVFLKGCNLRCPWCHNPETVSPQPQELIYKATGKRVSYGKLMSVGEIVDEVLEDEAFYGDTGGVTVSGGEPLLQSRGVAELFAVLKQKGISTLIDTAGCVPWEAFEAVLNVTDQFYFDVKSGEREKYSSVIRGDGDIAFENLSRLVSAGCRVHARVPLIPGFNTDGEKCESICRIISRCGVKEVDLIPFHRMGSSKYEALGREYAYRDTAPQKESEISKIAGIYAKYFKITIE